MEFDFFTPEDGEKLLRKSAHIGARNLISDLAKSERGDLYRAYYSSPSRSWRRFAVAWACYQAVRFHRLGVRRENVFANVKKLLDTELDANQIEKGLRDLTDHQMVMLENHLYVASSDGLNSLRLRMLIDTVNEVPGPTWWD